MRTKLFFLALAAAFGCSCSEDVDMLNDTSSKLSVSFTMDNSQSRASNSFVPKDNIVSGDEIGMFMYKNTWGTAYTGVAAQNNKATYGKNGYTLNTVWYLNGDIAKLWAYYPYSEGVSNGESIPISTVSNATDYLYGTTQDPVSVRTPNAEIQLKHALAQFVLRFKQSADYTLAGNVTRIELKTAGKDIATEGTLNVTNGQITNTTMVNSVVWTPSMKKPISSTPVDYNALVIPREVIGATLSMIITIDDVKYTFDVPAASWEAGYRYIHSFTLKNNKLEFGGSNGALIQIEGWKEGGSNDVTLTPVI